jgi:hypothetical protein
MKTRPVEMALVTAKCQIAEIIESIDQTDSRNIGFSGPIRSSQSVMVHPLCHALKCTWHLRGGSQCSHCSAPRCRPEHRCYYCHSMAELSLKALAMCRDGAKKSRLIDTRIVAAELERLLYAPFSDVERSILLLIRERGQDALTYAKSGKAKDAWSNIKRAEAVLQTARITPSGLTFATSVLNAQKAFCFYRAGDLKAANILLADAYSKDLALESQPEFRILMVHRIQLLNNLMRLYTATTRWQKAIKIGTALLSYLTRLCLRPTRHVSAVAPIASS